jgi:hypothetical protein
MVEFMTSHSATTTKVWSAWPGIKDDLVQVIRVSENAFPGQAAMIEVSL